MFRALSPKHIDQPLARHAFDARRDSRVGAFVDQNRPGIGVPFHPMHALDLAEPPCDLFAADDRQPLKPAVAGHGNQLGGELEIDPAGGVAGEGPGRRRVVQASLQTGDLRLKKTDPSE